MFGGLFSCYTVLYTYTNNNCGKYIDSSRHTVENWLNNNCVGLRVYSKFEFQDWSLIKHCLFVYW